MAKKKKPILDEAEMGEYIRNQIKERLIEIESIEIDEVKKLKPSYRIFIGKSPEWVLNEFGKIKAGKSELSSFQRKVIRDIVASAGASYIINKTENKKKKAKK